VHCRAATARFQRRKLTASAGAGSSSTSATTAHTTRGDVNKMFIPFFQQNSDKTGSVRVVDGNNGLRS
jgi:hypothetical protein